jgi:hypothetical protein
MFTEASEKNNASIFCVEEEVETESLQNIANIYKITQHNMLKIAFVKVTAERT